MKKLLLALCLLVSTPLMAQTIQNKIIGLTLGESASIENIKESLSNNYDAICFVKKGSPSSMIQAINIPFAGTNWNVASISILNSNNRVIGIGFTSTFKSYASANELYESLIERLTEKYGEPTPAETILLWLGENDITIGLTLSTPLEIDYDDYSVTISYYDMVGEMMKNKASNDEL